MATARGSNFEPWRQADAAIGDGGITVGEIMPVPIVHLMVAWMGVEGMTDGANRPLVGCLAQTDLPVIEAFTPPPMGNLGVAEAKAAWPDKVVWVNFPGNLFLESAEAIHAYTLDLLHEGAPGGRLVIGCTEDFPVSEFEKTFTAIGRALAEYEGCEW